MANQSLTLWQIIRKLIKRFDEEKNQSNNGMEKQLNCKSEAPPTFPRIQDHSPTFRRIQDILH